MEEGLGSFSCGPEIAVRIAARASCTSQEKKKKKKHYRKTRLERDRNKGCVSDPVQLVRPRPGNKYEQRRVTTTTTNKAWRCRYVLGKEPRPAGRVSLGLPPACLAAGRAGAPLKPLRGHAGQGGGRYGEGEWGRGKEGGGGRKEEEGGRINWVV